MNGFVLEFYPSPGRLFCLLFGNNGKTVMFRIRNMEVNSDFCRKSKKHKAKKMWISTWWGKIRKTQLGGFFYFRFSFNCMITITLYLFLILFLKISFDFKNSFSLLLRQPFIFWKKYCDTFYNYCIVSKGTYWTDRKVNNFIEQNENFEICLQTLWDDLFTTTKTFHDTMRHIFWLPEWISIAKNGCEWIFILNWNIFQHYCIVICKGLILSFKWAPIVWSIIDVPHPWRYQIILKDS